MRIEWVNQAYKTTSDMASLIKNNDSVDDHTLTVCLENEKAGRAATDLMEQGPQFLGLRSAKVSK